MHHGHGNLNKAIEVMDKTDRYDFEKFVNTKVSFNPHNMFICKSKKIMKDYYETIFPSGYYRSQILFDLGKDNSIITNFLNMFKF